MTNKIHINSLIRSPLPGGRPHNVLLPSPPVSASRCGKVPSHIYTVPQTGIPALDSPDLGSHLRWESLFSSSLLSDLGSGWPTSEPLYKDAEACYTAHHWTRIPPCFQDTSLPPGLRYV